MDILQLGAQLLSEKLGLSIDPESIAKALGELLGADQGKVDLAGLVKKMASSGKLSGIVNSWLSDGANAGISADSILDLFGESKLSDFASRVGTDTNSAASGLAEVLPQLIDKSSRGGSLLETAGGLGGLMGAAKSFLS